MAVITISRGTFAGGERLATTVADRLGYRVVSREQLYAQVQDDHSISLVEATEIMEQAPSPLDLAASKDRRLSLGRRRRQLLLALQASLCQLLESGNVVYHGLVGHLVLPGVPQVLRVRLIAPHALRVKLAQEREGLSHFEAVRRVDQVDSERQRWTQSFFGVSWSDPSLFDLVLNLERISVDEAAELAASATKLPAFRFDRAARKELLDLGLRSRVRAHLMAHPETAHLEVEVDADGEQGLVILEGMLADEDQRLAEKVARQIADVRRVERRTTPMDEVVHGP